MDRRSWVVGSRTMRRVFELAEQQHCRVVLSRRLAAKMELLKEERPCESSNSRGGIKPVVVSQIERQPVRIAMQWLCGGRKHRRWLCRLSENGLGSRGQRFIGTLRQMAHDYADIMARKESVLASAPTHAECDIPHRPHPSGTSTPRNDRFEVA